MWWMYFVVFAGALAVDLVPFIAPPAWTVMVFLTMKFDLNPWAVLFPGVLGSTLGRYGFSLYVPKLSGRYLKHYKNEDLKFLGGKLEQETWRSWLFVFIYSLTPMSTTGLFAAAGIAKVSPIKILPPFFAGKFIVDAIMLFAGRYAVSDLMEGTFSPKSLLGIAGALLVVAVLLFTDWHTLLQRRKLRLNFRIWK